MTNDNLLDQTVCNLPFEVVTIYDNGSQNLQPNTKSNLPPSVNVKIRIKNKEDTERRGIISVPRLTAINWPKKVRLVNSAQTIMSFNLAMEQNSDEAQKKSNRRLFQMFKPGGCLSIHRDEDAYSYMPSSSNELKRKSESGFEDYESTKITGTFALKKNDFSSSYTNTLKTPKKFLGKCKPGGCLDPPFGEDKYIYKPTVEDTQSLQHPVNKTNSLQPDINIMDVKDKRTSQSQKQNILLDSYPDTKILENTDTLVTYPPHLSSSKLKTKDSQNRKLSLRMGEQVDLSRKLTNEFPEAYFIPTRKEKAKNEKSFSRSNYEEKEPKIREAYINKDYILKSQTPSALLSDALTITSQSFDEPLKNEQIIRELNTTTPLLLKSEALLSNNTSEDNVKTISTKSSANGLKEDENTFSQDQNSSNHNNIPIIKKMYSYSYIKDSNNALYTPISRSSLKVISIQGTGEDIYYKNSDPNNSSNFEDKQFSKYSLELSKEISTKFFKGSTDQNRISIHSFEIKEQNNMLKQDQNVSDNDISNDEITNIKQLMEVESEEKNNINPLKDNKSASMEDNYYKDKSGQVITNEILTDETHSVTDLPISLIAVHKLSDDKSNHLDKDISDRVFENIRDPTIPLVQDLEFKDSNKAETGESVDQESERKTEQIVEIHASNVSDILPKTSLQTVDKVFTSKNSHSMSISSKSIDVSQKDSLFDNRSSKSTQLINEKINADNQNEPKKSFNILENKLSSPLIARHTSKNSHSMSISSKSIDLNQKDSLFDNRSSKSTQLINEKMNADNQNEPKKSFNILENKLSSSLIARHTSSQKIEIDTINATSKNVEISSKYDKLDDTDISLIPKMLQLNDSNLNNITLSNHDITNPADKIETVPQSNHEFTEFDSIEYRKSLSYSTIKGEVNSFNSLINDSKITLTYLQPDINNTKIDILSEDKSRKPSNELTNINISSVQTLPNTNFYQDPDKVIDTFLEDLHKSDSDIETSLQKLDNVQEFKIDPSPEIKQSFTDNKKNINSMSSVAINFGFHAFTNEKARRTIETFNPSVSSASYPQDQIVTVKTILRKNDSDVKVEIDSESDLIMQIKSTRQLNGSRKLGSKILKGYTNEIQTDRIRKHSSETLINKDKLLQETLTTVYENLKTIEKNIIKLKEEAESLYHEQLLLKKVLLSKEIRSYRLIPKVGTCSCLQKEIGLE